MAYNSEPSKKVVLLHGSKTSKLSVFVMIKVVKILVAMICFGSLLSNPSLAQEPASSTQDWEWSTSKAIAYALYESGEWELALSYLDALGVHSTDWYLQYVRARAALHLGDVEHASRIVEKALASHSENPRILFLAGDVALDSGDYEGAEAFLRHGLILRAKDRDAQLSLGRVLMAKGDFTQAAQHYEHMLSMYSASSEILLKLASCYENTQNLKRAELYLIKNSKLHQNPRMGLMPLQRFYQRHDMTELAKQTAQQLEQLQAQEDKRKLRQLQPSKR